MLKEKRRSTRRALRYNAVLELTDGSAPRGCVVSDISDTGAKLAVEQTQGLPDTFHLVLTDRGNLRRSCRTVWRTSNQIGVHFEKLDSSSHAGAPSPRSVTRKAAEPAEA